MVIKKHYPMDIVEHARITIKRNCQQKKILLKKS